MFFLILNADLHPTPPPNPITRTFTLGKLINMNELYKQLVNLHIQTENNNVKLKYTKFILMLTAIQYITTLWISYPPQHLWKKLSCELVEDCLSWGTVTRPFGWLGWRWKLGLERKCCVGVGEQLFSGEYDGSMVLFVTSSLHWKRAITFCATFRNVSFTPAKVEGGWMRQARSMVPSVIGR